MLYGVLELHTYHIYLSLMVEHPHAWGTHLAYPFLVGTGCLHSGAIATAGTVITAGYVLVWMHLLALVCQGEHFPTGQAHCLFSGHKMCF